VSEVYDVDKIGYVTASFQADEAMYYSCGMLETTKKYPVVFLLLDINVYMFLP
jgi:hypothetical protein